MATAETTPAIEITVVWSPVTRQWIEKKLSLAVPCRASDALACVGQMAEFALPTDITIAVWGRQVVSDRLLADGDRLEILRPLTVDPKVARQLRFKSQGAKNRSAGLFAKRREGAKAGY